MEDGKKSKFGSTIGLDLMTYVSKLFSYPPVYGAGSGLTQSQGFKPQLR